MHPSLIAPSVLYIAHALAAASSSPSPKASTDLICHTSHATECYPRIFQPSKHFKTVHDDQELPPGLHVRLNLQTGVKEARLNVPESDEEEYTAVAVSDDEVGDQQPLLPVISDQDTEREPPRILIPDTANGEERQLFEQSLAILKDRSVTNEAMKLSAIEDLEELCHSLDWGLTLIRDIAITTHLRELILSNDADTRLRSAAALLLSTAIRNNPPALEAAGEVTQFRDSFIPSLVDILTRNKDVMLLTRTTSLVSSLCQEGEYLHQFVANQGLKILLDIFNLHDNNAAHNNKLQAKIANFIHDYVPLLVDIINDSQRSEDERYSIDERKSTANKQGREQVADCLEKFEQIFVSHLETADKIGIQADQDIAYRSIYAAHIALSTHQKDRGLVT